jgi:uncharacterized integral membrane protein
MSPLVTWIFVSAIVGAMLILGILAVGDARAARRRRRRRDRRERDERWKP